MHASEHLTTNILIFQVPFAHTQNCTLGEHESQDREQTDVVFFVLHLHPQECILPQCFDTITNKATCFLWPLNTNVSLAVERLALIKSNMFDQTWTTPAGLQQRKISVFHSLAHNDYRLIIRLASARLALWISARISKCSRDGRGYGEMCANILVSANLADNCHTQMST